MPDLSPAAGAVGLVTLSPTAQLLGALAAVALLAVLSVAAASFDGVLAARRAGRPVAAGLAAPLDETARLLRQRSLSTPAADSLLWRIGGAAFVMLALLKVSLVPVGATALFPSEVGLVWFNAFDVAVWAAVWLTGWGANAVFPLIGGYRFLALAIAYELPLMFALTAPAIGAGSLDPAAIAAAQQPAWFALLMPVAFLVYCIAVIAFSVSGPFASPFHADLAGGVAAELSGIDRLLVHGGRYALLVAGAAFAVPLFLGGGAGPLLPDWAWVLLKTVLLTAALVAVRRAIPILRQERLLEIGWLVLLPLAVLQDLVVAIGAVMASEGG